MFTRINLVFFLLMALVVGSLFAMFQTGTNVAINAQQASLPMDQIQHDIAHAHLSIERETEFDHMINVTEQSDEKIVSIRMILSKLTETALSEQEVYDQHKEQIEDLRQVSESERKKSFDVLDQILANMLGDPIGQTYGDNSTIKVFSLKEAGYRGYMAKVRLHDPNAVQLVLANDSVGNRGETTSQAAKRKEAKLAINAGGYARGDDGLLYPIGITVVDGEIKTFYRTDLSFIGFNKQGNLVGGDITTKEQIEELEVQNGATFVPTLLKDGKKVPIPSEWKNARHPRTLVGHFSNGDVLFIVIDGRQQGYSNGVTLEEAQEKLLEFNVVDAYNLDGGGSSAFYYDGKLLNSPSDGKERPLPTNFVIMP